MIPTDKLGNELKAGQLVQLELPSRSVLAQVTDVSGGGVIGADLMTVPGQVVFMVILPVSVNPQNPRLDAAVVVQVPKERKPTQ